MASVHAPLNIKCLGADMGWDVIRTPHSTADDDYYDDDDDHDHDDDAMTMIMMMQ